MFFGRLEVSTGIPMKVTKKVVGTDTDTQNVVDSKSIIVVFLDYLFDFFLFFLPGKFFPERISILHRLPYLIRFLVPLVLCLLLVCSLLCQIRLTALNLLRVFTQF